MRSDPFERLVRSVARQVTRLAVGLPPASPALETFAIPLHVLQNDRQSEDLPLGSRGGIAIHHNFPVDGEYVINIANMAVGRRDLTR